MNVTSAECNAIMNKAINALNARYQGMFLFLMQNEFSSLAQKIANAGFPHAQSNARSLIMQDAKSRVNYDASMEAIKFAYWDCMKRVQKIEKVKAEEGPGYIRSLAQLLGLSSTPISY